MSVLAYIRQAGLPASQVKFLRDKYTKVVKVQPLWKALRAKLLGLGGDEVVAQPEPDLAQVLKRGKVWTGKAIHRPGKTNQCHTNTAALFEADKIDAIVTGYALSKDGLWRQHTWGARKGKLVETTTPAPSTSGTS